MANVPLIYGPDLVLREILNFSTTLGSRFLTGTAPTNTVDLEVSIQGRGYTNDDSLIAFDGETWTVPNPEVYPDGLDLIPGNNAFAIRAILSNNQTTGSATANIRYTQSSDLGVLATIPSNVSIAQLLSSVQVTVNGVDDTNFIGINYYASQYAGGGATGYTRINVSTVSSYTTVEETTDIGSFDSESTVRRNTDGTLYVNPQYAYYTGSQVDENYVDVQDDFTQRIAIPDTAERIRTSVSLVSVATMKQLSFEHSRTANVKSTPSTVFVNAFATLQSSDPLYYVTTAVYYDSVNQIEFESPFSMEVVGHPLTVSTNVGSFPVVSQQQVVRNTIDAIFRSNPQVKVEPGSYIRDVFIDPFSEEATRLRFIVDFLHRAQSFQSLLQIDDPNNTNTSVPVSQSPYKQALKASFGLTSDADTQAVIDRSFETLAGNLGVYRRPGLSSRGKLLFYTTKRPTQTLPVPVGTIVSGGSVNFTVTQGASIPLNQIASYYDPVTGRYQVTVSAQAVNPGANGNVAAGQIKKVVSGVTGLNVINPADMFGGKDQESNRDLATRALNAIASVDSSTKQGYLQVAADVPGVVQANVVSAGDTLMLRDMNAQGEHKGGKVDIWVRGDNNVPVTCTFAFGFDIATDIHFVVLGDPADLIFQAIDSNLSSNTPILALLDDPSAGYEFRNATTGESFDITDYTILSYNTIQLSTSVVQPSVTLTDVVLGCYRRKAGNAFTLPQQPVIAITSVVGTVSGTLTSDAYALYQTASPLLTGRSTQAGDYILITPVLSNGSYVPAGTSISVTGEQHVLIGEYVEYLDSLGVNPLTIVVQNQAGTVTYRGPNDPSGISDYTIIYGDETTPVAIKRVSTGDIVSGDTVQVAYEHDENFTVSYTFNNAVSVVQDAVNLKKALTADVLVKNAIPVPLDVSATVVLQRGVDRSAVDSAIRTNISNYLSALQMGEPIRQSDITSLIEGTTGVSYVEIPLTRMVRGSGSLVLQEGLATSQAGDTLYTSWSTNHISVWLILEELNAATIDGGGTDTTFHGVYQDDILLATVTGNVQVSLQTNTGSSYIIGPDGIVINGYSDDDTLIAQGYTTQEQILARRAAITGNRVLVSTSVDDSPAVHTYQVTYTVGVDTGAKNIDPGEAEYMTVGTLEFTYDEDPA